jgi:hypothetical protein
MKLQTQRRREKKVIWQVELSGKARNSLEIGPIMGKVRLAPRMIIALTSLYMS